MSSPDPTPASAVKPAKALLARYWRRNLQLMAGLLTVWFIAGLGCGILWADTLNQFQLGGFPLGFWFAQQGGIMVFVLLIWVYCMAMNRLDAQHQRDLENLKKEQP